MDLPNRVIPPISLTTVHRYSAGQIALMLTASAAQGNITWVANQAVYIPVTNPWYYPVARVFWSNGTVVTGNVDFGIYNWDGSQLYHTGSTAQVSASRAQFVTPASPFILPPGQYFFALACDGSSTNIHGVSGGVTTNEGRCAGFLQQASAMPLPASATFAQWASTGLPLCGVTRKPSL